MSTVTASTGPSAPDTELILEATEGLTRKASLNAVVALLDYVGKILVNLLLVPVLVAGLGDSLYGVWQILWRLASYMSVADGKPTDALRLVVANLQAKDDTSLKRRYVGSAFLIWLLYLPVLLGVGITIAGLAPRFTNVTAESYSLVRITCILLVINIVMCNIAGLPDAVLRGANLGYKCIGFVAGLNILGGILTAACVYAGFGLIGVAASQIAVSSLTAFLWGILVKKNVPWFGIARPTQTELRCFWKMSLWSWAGALTSILYWSIDVLILGLLCSASTVTSYVLTGYAAQMTISMSSLLLSAAAPGLGGLFGKKAYTRFSVARTEAIALSWLLATVLGSTILLWNRSFLFLWVGPQYYAGYLANFLIVMIMTQAAFIYCDSIMLESILRLGPKVIGYATAAGLCIAFACLLTPAFGIVGLCVALLAGRLVQSIALPVIVHSGLGRSAKPSLRSILQPGFAMLLLFAGSAYLGQCLLARNWLEWVACVIGTAGLVLCLALVTGLPDASRKAILQRVWSLRVPKGSWT